MKLLLCRHCFDVFKLDIEMRQCKCGKVRGRYDSNGATAETTDNKYTVNIALGNGSVFLAIREMEEHREDTEDRAGRSDYYQRGQGQIEYAWVRPNNGPGNPHTRLLEAGDDK